MGVMGKGWEIKVHLKDRGWVRMRCTKCESGDYAFKEEGGLIQEWHCDWMEYLDHFGLGRVEVLNKRGRLDLKRYRVEFITTMLSRPVYAEDEEQAIAVVEARHERGDDVWVRDYDDAHVHEVAEGAADENPC